MPSDTGRLADALDEAIAWVLKTTAPSQRAVASATLDALRLRLKLAQASPPTARERLSEIIRNVKVRISYIGHPKEPLGSQGQPSWADTIRELDEAAALLRMSPAPERAALVTLIEGCRCEISVTVNAHRNFYEPMLEYLADERFSDVPPDVRDEMIRRDTVVEVQFYPRTPVGFHFVAHWNLNEALREAAVLLKGRGGAP